MKTEAATLWPLFNTEAQPSPPVRRVPPPDFLLQRSPKSDRFNVWTLNLGKGRARDFLFCPERDSLNAENINQVQVFESVSHRLVAELAWRQPLPAIVQIGTQLDPFHDAAELQREVTEIVPLLAERRIVSWFVTRGNIPMPVLDQWAQYVEWVRFSIAVSSHDRDIQKALEPAAATFEQRLQAFTALKKRGFRAEIILEPMLPNLTDTHEHLEEMLQQLSHAGVSRLTAGYLALRPDRKEDLSKALEPAGWSELVMSAYSDSVRIRRGPDAPLLLLPKARRQRGYALLMALAANVGMSVRLSPRSNPDFGSSTAMSNT